MLDDIGAAEVQMERMLTYIQHAGWFWFEFQNALMNTIWNGFFLKLTLKTAAIR